jgi:N4-(beta-N-acetylglucosaminyl)-L-asparaginase
MWMNACQQTPPPKIAQPTKPVVISTWNFGMGANAAAWEILSANGTALDAVEAGARVPELDPTESSVGYGGLPDRDGIVTLDACIMDHQGGCGSVAFLQGIKNPVSVARRVMEKTPHVMLAGEGARRFALQEGFTEENLLTPSSEKAWQEWLASNTGYQPVPNIENHDTIGILALDSEGNLSGACTTSGMAWKMHGRVGDSPIIGGGLFVDNEVGAATATGLGEEVIRVAGCAMVVEQMRMGKSPEEACKAIASRIVAQQERLGRPPGQLQVGFLALNKQGEYGAYCILSGFNYAVRTATVNELIDGKHLL